MKTTIKISAIGIIFLCLSHVKSYPNDNKIFYGDEITIGHNYTIIIKDTLNKTATFKVYGNCDMCKSRIEKALKTTGVKAADWEKKSKMLTVKYDSSMISEGKIHEYISSAGHDTEKMKAPDKVYKKLHKCCQYERNEKL